MNHLKALIEIQRAATPKRNTLDLLVSVPIGANKYGWMQDKIRGKLAAIQFLKANAK